MSNAFETRFHEAAAGSWFVARLFVLAVLAVLASRAGAQTPVETVGLTRAQRLLRQEPGACSTMACAAPAGIVTPLHPLAGGTATDARGVRPGVWISDGSGVTKVDPFTCRALCPGFQPGVAGLITGLAMHEPSGEIYVTTTTNRLYVFRASCPWTRVSTCDLSAALPAAMRIGGIAVDDRSGWLFLGISGFGPGGLVRRGVVVTTIRNPCTPICQWSIDNCAPGTPLGRITGVAWDSCRSTCYLTDGTWTAGYRVQSPGRCEVRLASCCFNRTQDPLLGLCTLPSVATSVGRGCTAPPCVDCNPSHRVLGVPYPGNTIRLDVVNAPASSLAYLAIGFAPCQSPGVSGLLCAPIHVFLGPPFPLLVGPLPLTGIAGCAASHSFALPLPNTPALCGLRASSTHVLSCPPSGAGTTNCCSWTIGGS